MEIYVDLVNLFLHPEDYADPESDSVVGKYDSATYLEFGIDEDDGRYYFLWEDDATMEDYYQEPGESLEDTWNRMIEDLKFLS